MGSFRYWNTTDVNNDCDTIIMMMIIIIYILTRVSLHSLYVTQGLSSKLHIGMRHHPNGLLRVT